MRVLPNVAASLFLIQRRWRCDPGHFPSLRWSSMGTAHTMRMLGLLPHSNEPLIILHGGRYLSFEL